MILKLKAAEGGGGSTGVQQLGDRLGAGPGLTSRRPSRVAGDQSDFGAMLPFELPKKGGHRFVQTVGVSEQIHGVATPGHCDLLGRGGFLKPCWPAADDRSRPPWHLWIVAADQDLARDELEWTPVE